MSSGTPWTELDAGLLTMTSTPQKALSPGDLLLLCRDAGLTTLVNVPSWEVFVDSMGRLVAAGLVIWSEQRFLVTAAGREVSPGGFGRYFTDLFKDTRIALNERLPRPEPVALGLTRDEFDQALAYVSEVMEERRTRRGRSGYKKWAEWHDAPPLSFGDCIEFLTYSAERDVVVKHEDATGTVRFEGTLGLPLPRSTTPSDEQPVVFPVVAAGADAGRQVELRPDRFDSAAYSSYDGVDYFTLHMTFDDGSSVWFADANAPSV